MAAVERASAGDRLQLASDVGPAPELVGAVLVLAPGRRLDLPTLRRVVGSRIGSIPRLRQHLVRAPFGGGGPYWVDEATFDVDDHVLTQRCPAPGGDRALLGLAAAVVAEPLPPGTSPWRLVHVTGLAGGGEALVAVFHHVLADGIGGLAVLAGLVDGAPSTLVAPTPVPPPGRAQLVRDNLARRFRSMARLPRWLAEAGRALAALRAMRLPKVRPSSLNRPTGPARSLRVVTVDLARVVDAAHREGATVNDVVLAAAGGALAATLRRRGEPVPDDVVFTVPVSGRAGTDAAEPGNDLGIRPVAVPGDADPIGRLRTVTARRLAAPPVSPSASMALIGPMTRLLARLHLLRAFIERQRRLHSFVTNLRGPTSRLCFLGVEIEEVIPVSAISGNVTVAFAVLSYAGTLAVTVVADPSAWPDLDDLRVDLEAELAALMAVRVPASP